MFVFKPVENQVWKNWRHSDDWAFFEALLNKPYLSFTFLLRDRVTPGTLGPFRLDLAGTGLVHKSVQFQTTLQKKSFCFMLNIAIQNTQNHFGNFSDFIIRIFIKHKLSNSGLKYSWGSNSVNVVGIKPATLITSQVPRPWQLNSYGSELEIKRSTIQITLQLSLQDPLLLKMVRHCNCKSLFKIFRSFFNLMHFYAFICFSLPSSSE